MTRGPEMVTHAAAMYEPPETALSHWARFTSERGAVSRA